MWPPFAALAETSSIRCKIHVTMSECVLYPTGFTLKGPMCPDNIR